MPKQYRTAQGKTLDMAALVAKNERTRAVGNMKVNARGYTIDSMGKIVVPVTQKVGDNYANTVGNKSAQLKRPVPAKVSKVEVKKEESFELTQEEKELEDVLEDDVDIEHIKSKETKK